MSINTTKYVMSAKRLMCITGDNVHTPEIGSIFMKGYVVSVYQRIDKRYCIMTVATREEYDAYNAYVQ